MVRVWSKVKLWLALHDVDLTSWGNMRNVKHWRVEAVHKQSQSKKAMAYIAMLVLWENWKERNARVFRNSISTSRMLVQKIKDKVALWSLAGATAISIVMPGE
jgi:hypothetical protein